MIGIAVIGFGYWGSKLVQALLDVGVDPQDIMIVDQDHSKKTSAIQKGLSFFTNLSSVLKRKKVKACIIATPELSHYRLAKQCLKVGKNLLVEKPLAVTYKEAEELVALAQKHRSILMVDQTMLFDQGYHKTKEYLVGGSIGKIQRIESYRISSNFFKKNTNVVVDLMPHDLSIFFDLALGPIRERNVSQQQLYHPFSDHIEVALRFPTVSTVSYLSWAHPIPRREQIFFGSKGILIWSKRTRSEDNIQLFERTLSNRIKSVHQEIIGDKDKTLQRVVQTFCKALKTKIHMDITGKQVLLQIKALENILTSLS